MQITLFKRQIRIENITPTAWILCLLLTIAPFMSFPFFVDVGYHDKQRILVSFFLTGCCVVTAYFKLTKLTRGCSIGKETCAVVATFFAVGFISAVAAHSVKHALYEWSSFLLLLTAARLLAMEIYQTSDNALKVALAICGYGSLFYFFYIAFLWLAFIANGVLLSRADVIIGFDNYRFFNHTQTVGLPILCLLAALNRDNYRIYWLWFFGASMSWCLLFFTGGRGTFVGIVSAFVITWYLIPAKSKLWRASLIKTAICGFLGYWIFFELLPQVYVGSSSAVFNEIVNRTIDDPTSSRTELWLVATEMIVQSPWIGKGPLHFAHHAANLDVAAHPHNWVLQIASEWGLIALFFVSFILIKAFASLMKVANYLRSEDKTNQIFLSAWLTTGFALMVDGLVSGLFVMPASQMWVVFYLGCAWGWTLKFTKKEENVSADLLLSRAGATNYLKVGLVTAIVLIFFLNGLFPEILDLEAARELVQRSTLNNGVLFRPRIWIQGFF